MRSFLLILLLLGVCGFANAIFKKHPDGEDVRPAATARELKARLEERLENEERELGVGYRGDTKPTSSSYRGNGDHSDGSERVSRNASKKTHYDEIELSFMIQMDEMADTTNGQPDQLGDKFVFTGKMAVDDDSKGWQGTEEIIGDATASCVVCLSAPQWCCDFFLTFNQNGGDFFDFATVSLSGYIEGEEGHLWVLGAGEDFVLSHNGVADVQLDPYGNPILYTMLKLHA